MKNVLTVILSVVLTFCLLMPVAAEDTADRLCEGLQQELEEATDPAAVFAVTGYLSLNGQMQKELIQQTHHRATAEIQALLGEDCDYAALAQTDFNTLVDSSRKQVAQAYGEPLINELLGQPVAVTATVNAGFERMQLEGQWTKEQIEKLAALSQVLSVAKPGCDACTPPNSPVEQGFWLPIGVFTWSGNTLTYSYTAADALNMLKSTVGKPFSLPAGVPDWVYDANGDKTVTADDALMALQSAVGNVVVSFPQSYLAR